MSVINATNTYLTNKTQLISYVQIALLQWHQMLNHPDIMTLMLSIQF